MQQASAAMAVNNVGFITCSLPVGPPQDKRGIQSLWPPWLDLWGLVSLNFAK
jgi:hypothetical protein